MSQPTKESTIRSRSIFNPSTLLTLACALAQFSLGYESTITSIVPLFLGSSYTRTQLSQTTEAIGLSHSVGIVFGGVLTFLVGGWLGRRGSLTVGAALAVLGCVVTTATFSTAQFIAGRVVSGVGGGFVAATAPVWQVEVCETRGRGRRVVGALVAKIAGGAVAGWVSLAYGQSRLVGEGGRAGRPSWRLPVAMNLVVLAALFAVLLRVPESPRWLVGRGRHNEALHSIAKYRGLPLDSDAVAQELHQTQGPSESDPHTPRRYLKKLFGPLGWCQKPPPRTSKDRAKRRMLMAFILLLFVSLSGGTTFNYYFAYFPSNVLGLRFSTARILNVATGTWITVCGLLGILAVDHLGRRGTILLAFVGQTIVCAILTALVAISNDSNYGSQRTQDIVAYVFYFLFLAFWSLLTVSAWLYQVEINAGNSRAAGSAVATIAIYVGGIAAAEMTPSIVFHLRGLMGTPFVGVNAVAVVLAFLFLPETTGRSLDWLDDWYCHGPALFVFKDRRATKRRWAVEEEESVDERVERHEDDTELRHLADSKQYDHHTSHEG